MADNIQVESEITESGELAPILNQSSISVNNTYSYANNTLFYAFVNPTYMQYYYRIVRRTCEWLDGFVIDFHNATNGALSTRMASAIMGGLAKQIVGKQITFKNDNVDDKKDTIKFADKWARKTKLRDTIKTIVTWCLSNGTALAKINKTLGGEYWLEAIRLDYCLFETDFRNNVTRSTTMIKRYSNLSNNHNTNNFFLVEERYFKTETYEEEEKVGDDIVVFTKEKRTPVACYKVHRYTGQMLTAELMASDLNVQKGISWEELPQDIKDKIKKDYSAVRVNEEITLPFTDTLGVYLFTNEGQDITMPSAMFGNSLIALILSELMAFDLAWSWYIRDMYNGKGQVVTPKQWNAGNIGNNASAFTGLDQNSVIQSIPGLDPEKDRPFNFQFDIRTAEWQTTQDNILRKIATKIGISPRVLSSYLDNSANQRTATEINEESDTASEWIETHRSDYEDTLNEIINLVLRLNGYTDEVQIKFATPSLVNKDRIIQRMTSLRDNGFVDDKTALKEIFPDLDNKTIETYLENAEKQRKEREKEQLANMPFADLG